MSLLPLLSSRILNTPLLMLPSKVATIAGVLEQRIDINATDLREMVALAPAAPEASRFVGQFDLVDPNDPRSGRKPYRTTKEGVAIINVFGSLVHRSSWLDAISGLTSYERLKHDIAMAAQDGDVASILLDIDSPGGEAIGGPETADIVAAAASVKPVVALANGLCCSAAYMIASSATSIVTTRSSIVGSIGVVLLHLDRSRKLDKEGLTPTLIHAGARKIDGNSFQPLSAEVNEHLQAEVNKIYALFVGLVASGRPKITAKAIEATEAATYLGRDAVIVGLADRVASFEQIIGEMNAASPITERLRKQRPPVSREDRSSLSVLGHRSPHHKRIS